MNTYYFLIFLIKKHLHLDIIDIGVVFLHYVHQVKEKTDLKFELAIPRCYKLWFLVTLFSVCNYVYTNVRLRSFFVNTCVICTICVSEVLYNF